jgi:predicted HTH transcriptional regulator
MSNIRDGGYLILGFEQDNNTFRPTGAKEADISTFNYDNVKSFVSEFADPYVEFFMEVITDEKDNKKFLVFTINEFNEIPVICKRDGLEHLEKGTIYTRSRRMPETVRVPTNAEMREIIDMAIEKGIRKYIETSYRGGLQIRAFTQEDEYEKELENIK